MIISFGSSIYAAVTRLIVIMGMWNIFLKFGKKGWWSLVPFVKFYQLGDCLGRQKEGFMMMILRAAADIIDTVQLFLDPTSTAADVLYYSEIVLSIPFFIFSIRMYLALTEAFGKRRRWIVIWLLFEWLAYAIFGFNRNFRPDEKYLKNGEGNTSELSGVNLLSDGSGLSINLRKRTVNNFFKKFTLLRDIHMTVPTGHMVLLLGGSGAGKTTFLNAVTGYEQADADILLGKYNIYKDYNRMKYDIGFVPQADLMRGYDTVYRTITDAASLRLNTGMTPADRKKRVQEVLDIFGLSSIQNSLVSKLSGGQRKRLSIAIEYISYPTLFILDEPDSGLDGVVARKLFEKLGEIADTGKIVMVITHTPDRVIDLFDDVIVLAKDADRTGRLAYYGPVKESYEFFGKSSMEEILLSINQKDEGGEGRADEFVSKYVHRLKTIGGEA